METVNFIFYCLICILARLGLLFWHPVFRVTGRKNIPEGPAVICCNHSGLADPAWLILGLRQKKMLRIMAKESLMHVPVLKYLFRWLRLIGVRRGENDVAAVKTAMKTLRDGGKLLIFPEGTRVSGERRIEGKTGAVMFASRADCPILPIFLTWKRRPFSVIRMVIGEPYRPGYAGAKPTAEDLRRLTDDLMDRIYALGEDV